MQQSVLLVSKNNEWFTPSIYVEAARVVMGGITLDPASCAEANEIVRADQFYTIEDDGLFKPLSDLVWCNPPYGTRHNKSNQGLWVKRVIEEYQRGNVKQAILLTNSHTDTRWFHQLFQYPICFTEGRINFRSPVHKTDTAFSRPGKPLGHTHGSAFTYLGPHVERFYQIFSQFGTIVKRVEVVCSE